MWAHSYFGHLKVKLGALVYYWAGFYCMVTGKQGRPSIIYILCICIQVRRPRLSAQPTGTGLILLSQCHIYICIRIAAIIKDQAFLKNLLL